jgi:mannitol-1-phosphate 5-dehydrogenase
VGGGAFPHIAAPLAQGLARRDSPVNLLICENLPDPAGFVRKILVERGGPELEAALGVRIGLVPCIISRMVPVPDPAALNDPLEVVAEPYARLPVDAKGVVGAPPPIQGLETVDNFAAYVARKLYVHNAGHAAAAYHGFLKGYTYIHEVMNDPEIVLDVEGVMTDGAEALHRGEGLEALSLVHYIDDLLYRFRNPYLGDTVARVGRDPWRKLGPEERFIGLAKRALAVGERPDATARAVVAALHFHPEGDPSADRLQSLLRERGPEGVLKEVCGLTPDELLFQMILEHL